MCDRNVAAHDGLPGAVAHSSGDSLFATTSCSPGTGSCTKNAVDSWYHINLLLYPYKRQFCIPVVTVMPHFCTVFTKQPKFIEMGHGCIHLSLALTFAQFCGTFNRFFVISMWIFAQTLQNHTQKLCAGAHSKQRLGTKLFCGTCFRGHRGPN